MNLKLASKKLIWSSPKNVSIFGSQIWLFWQHKCTGFNVGRVLLSGRLCSVCRLALGARIDSHPASRDAVAWASLDSRKQQGKKGKRVDVDGVLLHWYSALLWCRYCTRTYIVSQPDNMSLTINMSKPHVCHWKSKPSYIFKELSCKNLYHLFSPPPNLWGLFCMLSKHGKTIELMFQL